MFKKAIDNISFRFTMFKYKMSDRDTAGKYIRRLITKFILTVIKYVLIASIAFVFLYPFLYMIVTAMKSPADLSDPTVSWVPTYICSDNFVQAYPLHYCARNAPLKFFRRLLRACEAHEKAMDPNFCRAIYGGGNTILHHAVARPGGQNQPIRMELRGLQRAALYASPLSSSSSHRSAPSAPAAPPSR